MTLRLNFSLILLLAICRLSAQNAGRFFEQEEVIPFQVVYLHTDREFYFAGDTIWFAASLLDAVSHVPLIEDCNLYVELIDGEGKFVRSELFPLFDGYCAGYIGLYDRNMKEGNYLIRAYTDYLKPFGEEVFFTRTIKILEVKNSFGLEKAVAEREKEKHIAIGFFPEGGFLLEGKINQVAFEVTDEEGREVQAQCELFDGSGESLIQFETTFGGLGRFSFIPDPAKTYFVEVKGWDQRFSLPEVRTSGAKLVMGYRNPEYINLVIETALTEPDQMYYLAVMQRGLGLALVSVKAAGRGKAIRLDTKYMGNGINRLVLLNANLEPLSERLVFIEKTEDIPLEVKLNSPAFQTRERVEMELQFPADMPVQGLAQLSVTVINENMVNASGPSQNIRSFLLLDSELRGYIASPLSFFSDDEAVSSKQKLDLLMLTHGWSNYLWNTIRKTDVVRTPANKLGLTISGNVKTPNARKVLSNTPVILSVAGINPLLLFSNTNLNGDFDFENICFYDSAMVIIQGLNSRDKSNTVTTLTSEGFDSPELTSLGKRQLLSFSDVPISAFRMKYLNEMALNEYYPDRTTRVLESVDVVGQKKREQEDDHFRIYGIPDNSLKVDETSYGYSNVFQFLVGRVAGVQVTGNQVIIRGVSSIMGSNEPLFLLDGIPVDKESLEAIPMSSIDKVEVLKGAGASVFGMQGGNGVISVFTRSGVDLPTVQHEIPGTVIRTINGFSRYREFYSPVYTAANVDVPVPDYRTTLYWNPSVILGSTAQKLSFFTCDNLSNYKIYVEGVTSTGQICLGEGSFVVDTRRK